MRGLAVAHPRSLERTGPAVRPRAVAWVASLLACALLASPRPVAADEMSDISRDLTAIEGDAQQLAASPMRRSQLRGAHYVEERLTDGELFYRLQDYVRASIIFTDIVQSYPKHRAYPDALFLLGESLFRAGDYLGARTRYREILARSGESAFRPYVQKALGRLIEIAIHTRDFTHMDEYFQRLSRLPPQEIEAATAYFRAKYLYNKAVPAQDVLREGVKQQNGLVDTAGLEAASRAFEAVPAGSPYYAQARYFIGVIYTLQAQYPQAIEAFRRVLRSKATTPEQQEVIDLTYLALGRLYYETDQIEQATEAYQSVPRTSKYFDTALYEIAWAYIRIGDSTRAERALEVLSVAAPDSHYIPDAKVLRGNLLLRNGRYDDANKVFVDIRKQFVPVRRKLEEVVAGHEDPQAYFRQLVRDNIEAFDASAFLPEEARRWVNVQGDLDRALGVLSDLSQAKRLVAETTDLILRLRAAIDAPNHSSVFPDMRRQVENITSLRNRLSRVRKRLVAIEERQLPSGNAELMKVRQQRRQIEELLGKMPTGDDDFVVRDDQLRARYKALQRQLSQLGVELTGMEARITAANRFLEDTKADRDPSGVAAIETELEQHRNAVQSYRDRIKELKRQIEVAKLQVGVGDVRYQRDERLRQQYTDLVEREHQLMAQAGVRMPAGLNGLFARVTRVESVLDGHEAAVEKIVAERIADIRKVLEEETENVEGYRQQATSLEGETETVVGGITYANFNRVRKRFYDLVLRADVGRVDVAWARREEHRMRIDMLTRDRSREIKALDDEFREIMDEGNGSSAPEAQ